MLKDLFTGKQVESSTAMKSGEYSFSSTAPAIMAGIVGVVCGLLAVAFDLLIDFCHEIFFTAPEAFFNGSPGYYKYLIIPLTPAVGGLAAGLLTWFFRMGHDSPSISEIMKWSAVSGGVVKKRVVWLRLAASSLFLGSGGSGGPEGPIAQIGAASGSVVGQLLGASSNRLRLLVGCGAAAGIAASFNAPMAGVIFSVELILGDFNVVSFLPIVISAVMSTTTKRLILGDTHLFIAPTYTIISPWEILLYALLGAICGIVARVFVISSIAAENYFKKIKVHWTLKPAIGGLFVGIIGVFLPEIFGKGYSVINNVLNGEIVWTLALTLLVVKTIATAISLGSGGSGGQFAPALFIGAMAGEVFGHFANVMAPGSVASPGAYAMVGLGAVMAAVAHAPMTNILMGYELTGNYQIILPIMTSCIISTYVITRFSEESYYTEKLRQKGIILRHGRDLAVMDRIKVRDVMSGQMNSIPENLPFGKIMELIITSRDSYFPMVNSKGELSGIISIQNVREILLDSAELCDLVVAKDIATENVITVHPDHNLNEAMELFAIKDVDQLPVVDSEDNRKVVGMLRRMDVLTAYKKEVLKKPLDDDIMVRKKKNV